MEETTITRIEELKDIANEVRFRIVDMVYRAQSGHCGGSLSAADIVTALYFEIMKINPAAPDWPDRDRFILSKGHACPVQYAALSLKGYFPLDELGTFRKLHSRLQGHPVAGKLPGIEVTTGSLGIGFCEGIGLGLDAKLRKQDWRVWIVLGDGELNEGAVWEAAQAGSKFHLDNVTAIVDRNRLQNDGFCDDVMPIEPVVEKFRVFGWETYEIDGHNMSEIVRTLHVARQVKGKPTCIVARTVKGKGVSFMENVRDWHGKAPNSEQYEQAVRELRGGRT